jgi:hypothetical protein
VQKDSHERKKIATRCARPASSQFGWRKTFVTEILQAAVDRMGVTDAAEVRPYGDTINCKFKPWKARKCAGAMQMTPCTNVQLSSSGNHPRGTPAGKLRASYNLESDPLRPLGTWDSLQINGREAGGAALKGEMYGTEGDRHPSREPAN